MEKIGGYILSIVAAAALCALSGALLEENTAVGKLGKQIAGLLLTVTVISPLTNVHFRDIGQYLEDLDLEAEAYADYGEESAGEEMGTIIKSRVEAYILDKASAMDLDIAVGVELGENDMAPYAVTVNGAVSPYAKEVLAGYMESNLGIARENQQWN